MYVSDKWLILTAVAVVALCIAVIGMIVWCNYIDGRRLDAETMLIVQQQRSYPYADWNFSTKSPVGTLDPATAKKLKQTQGVKQASCNKIQGSHMVQCVVTVDTKSMEKQQPSAFGQAVVSKPASVMSDTVRFAVDERQQRPETQSEPSKININMNNHANAFKVNHSKTVPPPNKQPAKRSIEGLTDDMFEWSKSENG